VSDGLGMAISGSDFRVRRIEGLESSCSVATESVQEVVCVPGPTRRTASSAGRSVLFSLSGSDPARKVVEDYGM
jgi:hypothetical protein